MFLARTEQLGLATPPTQFTAAQQASGPRPVAINQKNTTQESTNWQFFLRGRKMDWSLFALSSLSHQNALTLKFPHDVHHRVQPQPRPPPIQCLPRLYWCQDLVTTRNHKTVLHETSAPFDLPLYLVMSSTPPPWAWCLSYLHDALPPLLQSQT